MYFNPNQIKIKKLKKHKIDWKDGGGEGVEWAYLPEKKPQAIL